MSKGSNIIKIIMEKRISRITSLNARKTSLQNKIVTNFRIR